MSRDVVLGALGGGSLIVGRSELAQHRVISPVVGKLDGTAAAVGVKRTDIDPHNSLLHQQSTTEITTMWKLGVNLILCLLFIGLAAGKGESAYTTENFVNFWSHFLPLDTRYRLQCTSGR